MTHDRFGMHCVCSFKIASIRCDDDLRCVLTKGVGTADPTGALAPAMLRPRGESIFRPAKGRNYMPSLPVG